MYQFALLSILLYQLHGVWGTLSPLNPFIKKRGSGPLYRLSSDLGINYCSLRVGPVHT